LAIGVMKVLWSSGHPEPVTAPPALPPVEAAAGAWLLMRSFASGCTAMTGVGAGRHALSAFPEPCVSQGPRTLTVIIVLLAVMLAGIAYLCGAYKIGATEPGAAGYDSILSQLTAAVVGRGWFYFLTIGSVLSVLALSANTAFADFPRL